MKTFDDENEKKKILTKSLLEIKNVVKRTEENFSKNENWIKLNNLLLEIEDLKNNNF
jgi:hypothetical protein